MLTVRARHACLLATLLLASAGCGSTPERDTPSPAPPPVAPVAEKGQLGVSDPRIQLWLLYGPCRQRLEERKIAWVVEQYLQRRAAAQGEAIEPLRQAAFDVDARVEAELARTLADFTQRFPELDAQTEMRRSFRSGDWFRQQLHWTFVFDGLFLPADEGARPEETRAAIQEKFGTQAEEWSKPWRGADGSVDPQYTILLRQVVRDRLFEKAHFTSSLEGPDFSIALRSDLDLDGRPELELATAEAWKDVADTVTPEEIEDARRFWEAVLATRASLERDGRLLSADERELAFVELTHQLNDFVPTIEVLAVEQERFPSVEAYREFHGLATSFRRQYEALFDASTGSTLPPELTRHLELCAARLGGAEVDADVLLVSAYDFPNARWKPDGRVGAWKRAQELRARWEAQSVPGAAGDELWNQLLDEHSEWWDPPLPKGVNASEFNSFERKHGRFGALDASRWREVLDLTRCEQWLGGSELLDAILRDLPIGAVGGPYEHRYGALLVRVRSRGAPARALDPSDPPQRAALADDYVEQCWREYTRAALARAREPARR